MNRSDRKRRRRFAGKASGVAFVAGIAIAVIFFSGYRINQTPSEALGLWRIVPLDRPASTGDKVFICPPVTEVFVEARSRGYLRAGTCAGRVGPLLKTVIAIAGQRVEMIERHVLVDGAIIEDSTVFARDAKGRTMHSYSGGVLPAGSVFLHSGFPGSWDSRYFGPLPASGILGFAREVLTFAP